YTAFGNDCQNFASQALFAGGWPTIGDQFTYSPAYARAWWYVHGTIAPAYSYTWSAVAYFTRFVQFHPERGTFVRYWNQLDPGDLVQVDWDGDVHGLKPSHTMIVTWVGYDQYGFDLKLTYHTYNRRDRSLHEIIQMLRRQV